MTTPVPRITLALTATLASLSLNAADLNARDFFEIGRAHV